MVDLFIIIVGILFYGSAFVYFYVASIVFLSLSREIVMFAFERDK